MNLRALLPIAVLATGIATVRAAESAASPATNNLSNATTNAPALVETNVASLVATNTGATNVVDASTNKPARDTNLIEAFQGMQIRKGFRLQLVAGAPLVKSPVAIAFDASGRCFVAEQGAEGDPGRIKLLEDPDADGSFEKAIVFADQLTKPTAIACYSGGLFVAAGGQILFLSDTNNDGAADLRRDVYTGFETTLANGTPGGGINNFTWGLDNRIHAAAAGVGGNISCLALPTAQTLSLDGFDFAFDPRTLALAVEADGVNRGVSFDNAGRRFTCNATRPAQMTVCDPIRATRNPLFVWPQLTTDLAPPNGFRLASGLHVYRGGALPANFVNDVFVADPILGSVIRLHLREDGFVPALDRPAVETSSPFLFSRELNFRPVQIVSGPDGTLYVVDLAREKLAQFSDTGRIWRISPAGLKQSAPPKLAAFKSTDLVALLASPNGWVRDTAARLLYERRDANTIPLLSKQLARARDPLARLHSLQTLSGLEALTENDVLTALGDDDDRVREHAVRQAAGFVRNGNVSNDLWSRLAGMAGDRSPRVRLELAFTVGAIQRNSAPRVLANIVRASPGERAVQFAVLSAATGRSADVFLELFADARLAAAPGGWEFIGELAKLTGTESRSGMDDILLAIVRAKLSAQDTLTLARQIGEGLATGGRTFVSAAPQRTWQDLGSDALNIALGDGAAEVRAEAIRFLGVSGYSDQEVGDWLLAFLVAGEPQTVQSATIWSLARYQNPAITTAFVQRWPGLTQTSQREIIAHMLARYDRAMALMTALEDRRIPASALTDVQVNFLRSHPDVNIAARALRLYGPTGQAGLVEQFSAALQLKGSAARGRELFTARCASCHQLRGEGRAFGPDLDNFTARDREKLMQDILDPSSTVAPAYQVSVVQRTNSELVFGLVKRSGRDVLQVRQPGAQIFIPRTQVEDTIPQKWSLMPDDTAAGLSVTDLADLLDYLTAPR